MIFSWCAAACWVCASTRFCRSSKPVAIAGTKLYTMFSRADRLIAVCAHQLGSGFPLTTLCQQRDVSDDSPPPPCALSRRGAGPTTVPASDDATPVRARSHDSNPLVPHRIHYDPSTVSNNAWVLLPTHTVHLSSMTTSQKQCTDGPERRRRRCVEHSARRLRRAHGPTVARAQRADTVPASDDAAPVRAAQSSARSTAPQGGCVPSRTQSYALRPVHRQQ